MVGSGTHVFALMGYVIAHQRPDPKVGGQVRLNPVLLATIFGETEQRIQQAVDFLCSPDPNSTTPDEGGRRLIKIGQFDYRVVNAAKYLAIRNEEERREANRVRQANHRAKTAEDLDAREARLKRQGEYRDKKAAVLRVRQAGEEREERFVEATNAGNADLADKIVSEGLPEPGVQ